jgi:rubrerythrin
MDKYPNIEAALSGMTSGSATEWPQLINEIAELKAEVNLLKEENERLGSIASQINTDWVPANRKLSAEVERLKQYAHEYICKRCGIRQNSNQDNPTF